MAKKKKRVKKIRAKKYDNKLAITGSLEDVLKASLKEPSEARQWKRQQGVSSE